MDMQTQGVNPFPTETTFQARNDIANRVISIGLTALSVVYVWISYQVGASFLSDVLSLICLAHFIFLQILWRDEASVGSRLGILTAANFAVAVFSISMGKRIEFYHFFLSLGVIPLLVFENREKWAIRYLVVLSLVLYLLTDAEGYRFFPSAEIDPGVKDLLYWALAPFRFFLLVVGAAYLAERNARARARGNLIIAELKESEKTSRALLAAIPDMIFRVSGEGRFLDFHCHLEKDLFLPPEKLVGKFVTEVFPEPIGRQLLERVQWVLQHEIKQVFTFDLERPGGARSYEARIVASSHDEALIITQDITERMRIDRTIAEQRAMAAAASKMAALGEMAGGIAHEINNPLAIIRGHAQQLKELAEAGELPEIGVGTLAERIESTSMRISKIVKSLRTFAREGQNDPFEAASVQAIVADTLELCRARFLSHMIDLRVIEPKANITIECRAIQIGQVLLNLLNNAHDAVEKLPAKWIEIDVSDWGRWVEIAVTDSGAGIPAQIRDKILLPFFTTKEIGKGTGLGLSISKGIVENHRGELFLNPQSRNTCFVVRLPKSQVMMNETGRQTTGIGIRDKLIR